MGKEALKLNVEVGPRLHLLTIRGKLAPSTVEQSRQIHNQTAGNPDGVAMARSLGDLSHVVYVPAGGATGAATELLILDQWNSLAGLNGFFANAQVQQGGGMIFKSRDPVVWEPADALPRAFMPPPAAHPQRYVGLVRGSVRSRDQAKEVLGGTFVKSVNQARKLGLLSREYYWRAGDPGSTSLELLGFDVWYSAEGMKEQYSEHEDMAALGAMFAGRPDTSVWERPSGEWVEW